jgi:hypothetical protein
LKSFGKAVPNAVEHGKSLLSQTRERMPAVANTAETNGDVQRQCF